MGEPKVERLQEGYQKCIRLMKESRGWGLHPAY